MPDRRTRTTVSLLALFAGVAGVSVLPGCSDRGADSRKVAEAARDLGSVGNPDGPSSSGSYADASSKISAISVGGEDAGAITAGLLGQSLQGEASVAAKEATLAERSVLSEIADARHLAARFTAISTEAETLEAFDPTPDLDRIAQEVRAIEAAARDARSARAALADRINDLQRRAQDLQGQSDAKRNQAAEMELASASLSATQAAARAGEIRKLSREADALGMHIARLTGEVETLTPRLSEFDAELEKFSQQLTLASESADDLRQMATERAARARTARAEASEIAEQIREIVNSIDTTRNGTVIPVGEQATQTLERSIRESEKAARSARPIGTLGKSAAQRRLGELYQLRSDGHARYAELLAALGSIGMLPNAAGYADAASQESDSASGLRTQAAEAYENAANSLSSANVRGTDADRARETAERLNELARQLRGEPDQLPDQSADAPAEAPREGDDADQP